MAYAEIAWLRYSQTKQDFYACPWDIYNPLSTDTFLQLSWYSTNISLYFLANKTYAQQVHGFKHEQQSNYSRLGRIIKHFV